MTTMPHECGPDGNMKSAPQYICELAAWGRKMEARIAELESGIKIALAEIEGGCYADAHSTLSSL